MSWDTKTLHPSLPASAPPLWNFWSRCGPTVKKFANLWLKKCKRQNSAFSAVLSQSRRYRKVSIKLPTSVTAGLAGGSKVIKNHYGATFTTRLTSAGTDNAGSLVGQQEEKKKTLSKFVETWWVFVPLTAVSHSCHTDSLPALADTATLPANIHTTHNILRFQRRFTCL